VKIKFNMFEATEQLILKRMFRAFVLRIFKFHAHDVIITKDVTSLSASVDQNGMEVCNEHRVNGDVKPTIRLRHRFAWHHQASRLAGSTMDR